jgi:hypothetical protein
MSDPEPGGERPPQGPFDAPALPPAPAPPRYGRYVGLLGLLILALITVNTLTTKPNGAKGVPAGAQLPPFAVPLAKSDLRGYADIAPSAGQGARHAACDLRGPRILNICEQYEHAPVVLVLFVELGGCAGALSDVQALVARFPSVHFAAVSLRGDQAGTRRVIRSRGLTFPVGIDEGGVLADLYKVASCPQLTFAYPGGEAQGNAYLGRPSRAQLNARVQELVDASRARAAATKPGATTPGTATSGTATSGTTTPGATTTPPGQ